ncbi:MAG: (d)CMP kinase [Clostridia bacterium]
MINIAIDGPSGSGKSTIAKMLSEKMGITYLDTGAMYRGIGYFALKNGIDPSDDKKVIPMLDIVKMQIVYDKSGTQKVFVNDEDVTPFIREHKISMAASTISKIPAVRLKLVELQREIAQNTDCVLDGRDIGSYVLPNANYKFFMTATSEERALRRHKELLEKGQEISYREVLNDIVARDNQDSTRSFAPLKIADNAIVIDTTKLSIEQVATKIMEIVCK